MSNPFVAEIRMFSGNFPPTGWAFCNGQLMAISQNTALFSLLGTTYGGDGKSNFALPNLQGSAPMHPGQGPGLSLRDLGEAGGEQSVTLLQTEIPSHNHGFHAVSADAAAGFNPANGSLTTAYKKVGPLKRNSSRFISGPVPNVDLSPLGTSVVGGNLPHNNMPPFLALSFIIALQGVFPPRS